MKKFYFLFLLVLLPMVASADVCALQNEEKEPYAVLSEDNTVLTFYYDDQKAARNGMGVGPFTESYDKDRQRFIVNTGWYEQRESITSVLFDESFANCTTLTSTAYWFYNLENLSSITGISNLKTDNVTDMQEMFHCCFSLTSLDVTGFKTDNVTNMSGMFSNCTGLTSLDVTNFKTDNVTDMQGMFHSCFRLKSLDVSNFKTDNVTDMNLMFTGCSGLKSIDVSGFKTDNVTRMYGMFSNCTGLTSLDVSNFKTDNVTDMSGMFSICRSLTSLDLSNFKTDKVRAMERMFEGSYRLNTIYTGDGWSTANTAKVTGGKDMFKDCTSLVGGAGTTYSADHTDHTYAHIDGGASNPGYFTDKNATNQENVDDATNNDKTKRTIHVETAGTLPDLISADDKYLIEELTLTGNLNGTDIFFIRDMAGVIMDYMETEYAPGYRGAKTNGNLKFLDLSDANIVEGGRDYYRMMWSSSEDKFGDYKYTQANTISECMFAGCWKLEELILPRSVTFISSPCADIYAYVPIPMNIKKLKVAEGNPNYISLNDCNAIIEKETKTLIAGCATTVIPEDVTSISANAFRDNEGLTSITIPNSVTSIGIHAFDGCSALTSLEIPNSVTSIDIFAFYGCSGLASISIPSSVTSINRYAFDGCSGLESVTSLATTPPQAEETAFTKLDIPLYVPKGTRDAYLAASPWNKFKEIIEMEGTDMDEITIKDIGKTTWCSEYDLDFTNVVGIKAYTATGYDNIDKTIWLTRVMKVPAGTGLLVKGDPGTYKIPHVEVQSAYANWFVGNLGDQIKIEETDGDKTNYYLSGKDGTFVSVNGSANIGKNKAYLQLPTSVFGGTRSIGISYDDEDGTTGVKEVKSGEVKSDEWFTLQGQRVAKPGKGLYIKNGKKVIVR